MVIEADPFHYLFHLGVVARAGVPADGKGQGNLFEANRSGKLRARPGPRELREQ